ncbi:hypothetical protein [Phaeodactylibacter xiamenensis]|uniref:Uncharacterized protein n=1 Tax=Phaeodactylibacter xiamenensis TaxID=1524460 RepID=A0A098SD01_9BACT|nr:hypothetical protein [Phaeodactylibacter xiamenensis]KGE88867.1 hypothetical protein IX84_06050 [Phaeodactylibacter xiamenensis]MCR9055536.1 hypothetical protein [bacterium]
MRIVFVLFTLALLGFGCTKDSLSLSKLKETLTLIDIYRAVTNESLDASLTIDNYQANFGFSEEDRVTLVSTACVPGKDICKYSSIAVDDLQLKFEEGTNRYPHDPIYNDLFGKTVSVSLLEGEGVIGRNGILTQLYIPHALEVDINEVPQLSNSFVLNWNADQMNELGVYIIVQYAAVENPNFVDDFPEEIVNYIQTEDDGSYVFQVNDFPDIPEGSLVTLKIIRGAFELAEEGEDLIRVFALSHVTGYARF